MKLDEIDKQVTQSDISALEKFADRLFAKVGIDVEFTRHFLDRVNDERNSKQITMGELTRLFKQEFKRWGKPIAQMGPDQEAVMKDMVTNINMPFALRWDHKNNELDLIAKTVMRKKDFKTSNKEFPVESIEESPSVMSSQQMLTKLSKEMQGTHTGTSNPNSDWSKFVLSHKGFTLKDVQVDQIPTAVNSDGMSQANIEKYKQADLSKFPPMVIGNDGYILDGNHRLQAYKAQGIKTVKAYIGEEVEVSLHGDAKKGYVLSKIEVSGDERNAGQGTKAMQDIVDRMDREGATIALTPDDAFGGNKNRLIKFYKRFGFVPNKGRNKDFRFRETMIRYPQSNESVNEVSKEEFPVESKLEEDTLSPGEIVALATAASVTLPVMKAFIKGVYKTGKGYLKLKRLANKAGVKLAKTVFNEEKLETSSIITPSIKTLDKIFKQNKFEIRIVGGAVRDIALGKEPKDIDFATDATPDDMQKMFDKAGIRHIPTGIEHGTITAVINGEDFEITTLRADKETDGRHAEVEFVKSWEEDAKRRDLTYNAMSMDIDGEIYDYHNGMDDLQDKVSKFVGDPEERITEDYLRILRYFRFQGRLSTPTWDGDTLHAIKTHASGLSKVSAERIWMEMSKILSGKNVSNVLSAMQKTGVSKVIGLSTDNTKEVKDGGNPIVTLSHLGNNTDIAKRWKMKKTDAILLDFLNKNKTNTLDQKKVKDMVADGVDKELISALAQLQGVNVDMKDTDVPEFPVTGNDLIAKGMKRGPELGMKLNQLKTKWKQSNFTATKDELLKEKSLTEVVHRFSTGHDITFGKTKYKEIEVEVTGVDNANRKYQITILSPKELFGKTVSVSAKYMERGPWTKTKTGNAFEDSTMNEDSEIYQFNNEDPNNPEVYIHGYGRLMLNQVEDSVVRKLEELVKIAKRGDFEQIQKLLDKELLQLMMKAIVDTKEELQTIRKKGGPKSRGINKESILDVLDEESPWELLKRKAQPKIHHNRYQKAAERLHSVLKRKEKENGGKWRHGLGWYVSNIADGFKGVDSRALQDYYLTNFDAVFEDVNETAGVGKIVPGINTTVDVGPNEITKQAAKFGNKVDKDGKPKGMLTTKK